MAIEANAKRVILDDYLARRIAKALGLHLTGTLGILVVAKQGGLIDSIRPHLDMLVQHGFFISRELYRDSLESAGELHG